MLNWSVRIGWATYCMDKIYKIYTGLEIMNVWLIIFQKQKPGRIRICLYVRKNNVKNIYSYSETGKVFDVWKEWRLHTIKHRRLRSSHQLFSQRKYLYIVLFSLPMLCLPHCVPGYSKQRPWLHTSYCAGTVARNLWHWRWWYLFASFSRQLVRPFCSTVNT